MISFLLEIHHWWWRNEALLVSCRKNTRFLSLPPCSLSLKAASFLFLKPGRRLYYFIPFIHPQILALSLSFSLPHNLSRHTFSIPCFVPPYCPAEALLSKPSPFSAVMPSHPFFFSLRLLSSYIYTRKHLSNPHLKGEDESGDFFFNPGHPMSLWFFFQTSALLPRFCCAQFSLFFFFNHLINNTKMTI